MPESSMTDFTRNQSLEELCLGGSAQLDQQAQLIPIVPAFSDLAAGETLDADAVHTDVLASGRCIQKCSGVGHRCRPTRNDLVVLLDGVMNLDVNIGECAPKTTHKLFEMLWPTDI